MTDGRDAFTQFEYAGWERVAGKYESAWSGLTRLYIPALLEAVEIAPGSHLLDVACGPGYAAGAARAMGASVAGVDFSPEMVRLAQSRNPGIPFVVGDAQSLVFDDESFDAVLMNFGALHLARPDAAFAEARRVLREDGRYAFTVWASPEHSPGARIVEDAIAAHADPGVALPKVPDYFAFDEAEACRAVLGRAGFDPASLVFRTVMVDWQVPSASFLFEAKRDAGVRTAAVLAAQKPEVLAAIEAQIASGLQAYAHESGFRIPYAAHVIAVRC